MFFILIVVVLTLCAVYICDYLINYNEKALLIRKIPGYKNHFLIGNALEIMVPPVELFHLQRRYANKHKDIYSFYSCTLGAVNIYNPEDIEKVVSSMKHHEKSMIYTMFRPWLQDGLLLSSGLKWQQRRKILTPAFHFNILRKYYKTIEKNSQHLVMVLEKVSGSSTDIVSLLSEHTLNTVCESVMGTELNNQKSVAATDYKKAIHGVIDVMIKRVVRVYLYPDILFYLTKFGRLQSKYLSVIRHFTENVIKSRKEAINNNEVEVIDFEENIEHFQFRSKKKNSAMLDLLISAENEGSIDKTGIQEEVDTFMFEGYDTTAAGLMFFLLSIANYPEIQEKLVSELRDIFSDTKRAASMEDLNKMQYMERCIKESLRLYPPVPFISRRISETVKLSNYTVPEGTFCHIHIYDLHRRADIYENPLEFNPDRFLPENRSNRHKFSYMPFSAGPRNCIGQKFAMLEMKSAITAILRNFILVKVTTPSDLVFTADLVLRNIEPIYVRFFKRKEII